MNKKYFRAGRKIKLEIETIPPYLSLWGVIHHIKDDSIIVDIQGEYFQKDDKKANCIICGDVGVYCFSTTIKGCIEGKLILSLPKPDEVQILQRRKYVRVPTDIDVKCFLIGIYDKKVVSNKIFPAKVMDISGGGLLLNSKLSLPIGTMLVFELELDGSLFVLTVKVLRNTKNVDGSSRELGCEYVGIEDSDRQKIIAYTNKIQRKARKVLL